MATTPRYTGTKQTENTLRKSKVGYQAPAYASSIALVISPLNAHTLINGAALTGALSLTTDVVGYVGDTMRVLLVSDGSTRTVTFSTGFLPVSATFAVTTAKHAVIDFVFNGTGWLETNRAISA